MSDVALDKQETGPKILPFYLVVDVSVSMLDNGKMDRANEIVPGVADALAKNPIVSDKVRFGVIDFSDDARVVLPLCDLLQQDTLPGLSVRGGTSYAAAFRTLRQQIEADVHQLKHDDGYMVHRPAVFFLSDGEPTDTEAEWKQAFAELTQYDKSTGVGFRMFPNVIPFGVDRADGRILKQLIHPATGNKPMRMYLTEDGADPAAAISGCAEILISSVIGSASNMEGGGSGSPMLPDPDDLPDGISAFDADDDEFL